MEGGGIKNFWFEFRSSQICRDLIFPLLWRGGGGVCFWMHVLKFFLNIFPLVRLYDSDTAVSSYLEPNRSPSGSDFLILILSYRN